MRTVPTGAKLLSNETRLRHLGYNGQLQKGKQVATVDLPLDYEIGFDITPGTRLATEYSSIVHFTTNKDCCDYGNRIPGIWFAPKSRKLYISVGDTTNGNFNSHDDWKCVNDTILTLEPDKYYHVKLVLLHKKISVFVNDTVACSNISRTDRKVFKNVKVYMADPWYDAADAIVRGLYLKDRSPSCDDIIGCAETVCSTATRRCLNCTKGYNLVHGESDKCIMPAGQKAKLSAARLTRKSNKLTADRADALSRRTLTFIKDFDASLLKLTYADHLRVKGNGTWCKWAIKVDGELCSVPIRSKKRVHKDSDKDVGPYAITGTCAGVAAGIHTMTIALSRKDSGADCATGWIGSTEKGAFFMEVEELNPAGQIATLMNSMIGTVDNGVLPHLLKYDKRTDTSQLRITWATNLRVQQSKSNISQCNWEVLIDGESCEKPSKIGVSMQAQRYDKDFIPVELVGWCQNIKRGPHNITVRAQSVNGTNCRATYESSNYLEVWEPTPQEQAMITYVQNVSTDTKDNKSSSVLSHTFAKNSSSSSIRILYHDNLGVVGNDTWCRWEVKVDGKSCKQPLAGLVFTAGGGDKDLYPATIVGECPDLSAGKHRIDVALTSGKNNPICYTGWTSTAGVMHALIEVQEISAVSCKLTTI